MTSPLQQAHDAQYWDLAALARAETMELPAALPANLPLRLRVLLDVHLRVTSHRWQRRRAAPDGTRWTLHGLRLRTERLIPVPPPGRTT